jgi:predicted permease
LQAFLPQFPVPLQIEVAQDQRLALFASALTLLTGLGFGLLPAARAARVDCASSLKQGGRGIPPGRHRARRAFLTAQVALSLILLVGAGLFLRAMRSARSQNPGFQVEEVGLLTVDARLANRTPAEAQAFFLGWLESLRRRPGVEAASVAGALPLGFTGPTTRVRVDGIESPRPDGFPVGWNAVSPGYFETLRIPLLSGRDFAPRDAQGAERVVIVSQSTAARFFPGQEPLGRTLRRADQALRIVGVAGDIATDRSGSREGLMVYLPFAQTPLTRASLVLRGPGRLPFEEARAAAAGLDPNLPVLTAMSLAEHAGASLFPERLAATVSGAFGLFGLLLASVGLYGLATYVVTERRHELAIRAALGARANDLRRLVLLQGLRPVAGGLALGLVGAVAFGRLTAAFVPAVGAFDATAFAGGALLLLFVALLATDLPARRAAVTAPAEVLRAE